MKNVNKTPGKSGQPPTVLVMSSIPPRECGIATYTQDLVMSLRKSFPDTFRIAVCALETDESKSRYTDEIQFKLNTGLESDYKELILAVRKKPEIRLVLLQHEFGLFYPHANYLQFFLNSLEIPFVVVFHTVLGNPEPVILEEVKELTNLAAAVVVMTHDARQVLLSQYGLDPDRVSVIAHGTHPVVYADKDLLKEKYGYKGRFVLSTFGLLGSGKSIETTLKGLPEIARHFPDVLFLIIGKTHPHVARREGEKYREMLTEMVAQLGMENHVHFVNAFLPLDELLEYLQLTDVYLFTSSNPAQAVSGTFSYAMSSGCPVVSTPIPHAMEVLKDGAGMLIPFGDSAKLAASVVQLLGSDALRERMRLNGIHRMASTSWQNSAVQHANLFRKLIPGISDLRYAMPEIKLDHIRRMTTEVGIVQFASIQQPDHSTGYTVDDNARALIAMIQYSELGSEEPDFVQLRKYLDFVLFCQQPDGRFLNYVNAAQQFTAQNDSENLDDSNGRVIWALGFLVSRSGVLPKSDVRRAMTAIGRFLPHVQDIYSPRAMSFIIKGLYYCNGAVYPQDALAVVFKLANRLVQMYRHENHDNWQWYESYLTYANSVLPEAMLCAWLMVRDVEYEIVARKSFAFLLDEIFSAGQIHVVSNQTWLHITNSEEAVFGSGEQPVDVAYTILALIKFYEVYGDPAYLENSYTAFSWFLGNNHLGRAIYNTSTGGCCDGLEADYVNLNQGAESSISYLMARLAMESRLHKRPAIRVPGGEIECSPAGEAAWELID